MADAGKQQVTPSPSWAAAGLDTLADDFSGEQLGAPARPREPYERVMVVYQSGTMLDASVCLPVDSESLAALVVLGDGDAYGMFPPAMLRTIVHEQCVPLRVIERIGLEVLRCEHPHGFLLMSSPLNINSRPECPACGAHR